MWFGYTQILSVVIVVPRNGRLPVWHSLDITYHSGHTSGFYHTQELAEATDDVYNRIFGGDPALGDY